MNCRLDTELKNNFYSDVSNDICGVDCEEICFPSLHFHQPDEQVDRTERITLHFFFLPATDLQLVSP